EKLAHGGYVRRGADGKLRLLRAASVGEDTTHTVRVPLVGSVPCGAPLLAEQNIEAMIHVSVRLARPPHRYFLVRARGDSMNLAGIHGGDLVLVRQQPTDENGEKVVAVIDDEATIKEFHHKGDAVILKARSTTRHPPI